MIIVPIFFVACFYLWKAERWMNYKTSYQSMIEIQINKSIQEHIRQYHAGSNNED